MPSTRIISAIIQFLAAATALGQATGLLHINFEDILGGLGIAAAAGGADKLLHPPPSNNQPSGRP